MRPQPQIPAHLVTYCRDDWADIDTTGELTQSLGMQELTRREAWRKAQDEWSRQHNLDRADFVELRRRQRRTPQDAA